jgi:hypothetical protein
MSEKTILALPGQNERTILALPGKKLPVPRVVKRTLQISFSVLLTAVVALMVVVGDGMLIAHGTALQGLTAWLAFIKKPDIQATALLTAIISVLFIYWQRDRERR